MQKEEGGVAASKDIVDSSKAGVQIFPNNVT
jgi:hypothetical protein